jgi:hypothetical protein
LISLEDAVKKWFRGQRAPGTLDSWDRGAYLDAATRLVSRLSRCQLEDGTLRDPWAKPEGPEPERGSPAWMTAHSYAGTARYVGAVARLLLAGRGREHVDGAMRAMDASARILWEGREQHRPAAEFEVLELVDGFRAFERFAGEARARQWRHWLEELDAERCYGDVFSERKEPRNANTFALASEQARIAARVGGSPVFVDRYLEYQRQWFAPSGMYRDPGMPMAYDLTVRKNLVLLRSRGYVGAHALWVEEMLELGGMASLFTQSATGQAPFGGRSSQYLFVEATLACVLEYEARRYAARGDYAKAGAFVRGAHLALESAAPWLAMDPPRHIRNGFPPESSHGIDPYGSYTVYASLAASLFSQAWHLADAAIPEGACPAESGEAAFSLDSSFHKVFASRRGWSLEIDAAADPEYDATGIGLVLRREIPYSLPLCGSAPGKAAYASAVEPSGVAAAIGPCWKDSEGVWRSLATCGAKEIRGWDVSAGRREAGLDVYLVWRVATAGTPLVTLRVALEDAVVRVRAIVSGEGVSAIAFQVPVIESDGATSAAIRAGGGVIECVMGGSRLRASCLGATLSWESVRVVNRNGVYRVARWEATGNAIECRLALDAPPVLRAASAAASARVRVAVPAGAGAGGG